LVEQLEIITREVYDFITRDDRLTLNVTEWCKKETCWERAIKEKWTITEHFKKSLIDLQEEKSELEEGKKERKIINQLNLEMEVVNLNLEMVNIVLYPSMNCGDIPPRKVMRMFQEQCEELRFLYIFLMRNIQ